MRHRTIADGRRRRAAAQKAAQNRRPRIDTQRKGADFERAVARALRAIFPAESVFRAPTTKNGREGADVVCPFLAVECVAGSSVAGTKRSAIKAMREAIRKAEGTDKIPVALVKDNRKQPFAVTTKQGFVELRALAGFDPKQVAKGLRLAEVIEETARDPQVVSNLGGIYPAFWPAGLRACCNVAAQMAQHFSEELGEPLTPVGLTEIDGLQLAVMPFAALRQHLFWAWVNATATYEDADESAEPPKHLEPFELGGSFSEVYDFEEAFDFSEVTGE